MITPASIQVRFSDIDAMGHVNNAVYLNYFESARFHYFNQLVGQKWDWESNGLILVKNVIEYIKPVFLHQKPEVYITLDKIGTKSFDLSYELKVDGVVFTKGISTLVSFDYKNNKSVPVHPMMVEGLQKL